MQDTKFHEHDCDHCIYLGSENTVNYYDLSPTPQKIDVDYYYHKGDKHVETVIARFGNEGDYASGFFHIPQSVKEYKEKNKKLLELSNKEVLLVMLNDENYKFKSPLLKATYLAIEQGHMNDDFKQVKNKLKM